MPVHGKTLISERFARENPDIVQALDLSASQSNSKLLPDIIFTGCSPSLAVVFCKEDIMQEVMMLRSLVKRIEDVEESFANSLVIVIGLQDPSDWLRFQTLFSGGSMRLHRVKDVVSTVQVAYLCLDALQNSEKAKMQANYFTEQRAKLVSADRSEDISAQAFERLGIPIRDAELIAEGFSNIERIVSTPLDVMRENSPADEASLITVASFFSYNATEKIRNGCSAS